MSFQEFMSKVRYWDNICARWMLRHFYIVFFEFVLVIIFFIFFFNMLRALDITSNISQSNITDQLLAQQITNTHIIIVLLIMNSFWMLFMFNGVNRLRFILKEISYNLNRHKKSR